MPAKSEAGERLLAARESFRKAADNLAGQLGLTASAAEGERRRSQTFSYFADGERYAIVVGAQEERSADLALAHGLRQCGDRKLVLILPKDHVFATLQRAAWLREDAQPDIWVHDGVVAKQVEVPTPAGSRTNLIEYVATRPANEPALEFSAATTPMYLGQSAPGIANLVEWATEHPKLDASHRQGERAWQCMGRKVLSIQGTPGRGLKVRAGIHLSDEKETGKKRNPARDVAARGDLDDEAQSAMKDKVKDGIEARLDERPDEHWLQAVLRRRPESVGVEQPALREVPAWRPLGAEPKSGFQRGFIDLVGLDGHGDVRIVETKLSTNVDARLVFQGLDYFIWAQVYRKPLHARLGAPSDSDFVVHYVLGADQTGKAHESDYVRAQIDALRPEVTWRFQTVKGWFNPKDPWSAQVDPTLLPVGVLPSEVAHT